MEREQTTIRLPADLKERLQREADRRGFSFNGLVIELLRCGLEQGQAQK
jgi:predicted HicB family RNase H-like nuclease